MSLLCAKATGNFTAAGTWEVVDPTSLLNAETGSEVLTTAYSGTRSSPFTPGAIEIDGIAVKLSVRTGTTGTISVQLELDVGDIAVVGTEVTINTADLQAATTSGLDGGWIFFKFGAPVTLLAATAYQVAAKTSSASQISLFRDGTADNIARFLRTTTTQAPAAGDDLIVAGEYTGAGTSNSFTLTMDETAATDYGAASTSLVTPALAICAKGTLTWGTTASTAYQLKLSGHCIIYNGGTLNMGTVATPMPASSSGDWTFDCVSNVDFGLTPRNGSTLIGQGASKTVQTLMTVDKVAGNTIITVADTTGMVAGDTVIFPTTSRTYSQSENKTISTVDSATQFTLTAGLSSEHSGTPPTQCKVGNITRNVKIHGASASLQAFIDIKGGATVDLDYVEIYWVGSATANKRGIDLAPATAGITQSIRFCGLHDFSVASSCVNVSTANNAAWVLVFSDNVLYSFANVAAAGMVQNTTTSGVSLDVSFDNNLVCLCATSGAIGINSSQSSLTSFQGNEVAGCNGVGIQLGGSVFAGTWANNVSHGNANFGVSDSTSAVGGLYSGFIAWRNSNVGFTCVSYGYKTWASPVAFGNATANFRLNTPVGGLLITSPLFSGDTTFATSNGIEIVAAGNFAFRIENGDFGTVTGIKTAHTNDISIAAVNCLVQGVLHNTKLASSTELTGNANMDWDSYILSQKHDQTAGNHKGWFPNGLSTIDTTIFQTASPSLRLTPNSASLKLESAPKGRGFTRKVDSGGTVTPSVAVRKSAAGDGTAYNGNQPRLIVRKNVAAGIAADTVLDTMTVGTGSWETLTGTTAAVTDDAVLEFIVDCDGTLGWINVDDFA